MASGYIRKRKLKSGVVYAVSIAMRDPHTGEMREQERGRFKTKREATAALAKLQGEADAGTLVERSKCTVAEMLEYWMETEVVPNRRPPTADRYRYAIEGHLIPGLGSIQIQSLTAGQVQKWYAHKKSAGTGASTITGCHQILRSSLRIG